jgi:hypothetical protein
MYTHIIAEQHHFRFPSDRALSAHELVTWINDRSARLQSVRTTLVPDSTCGITLHLQGVRLRTAAEREEALLEQRARSIVSETRLAEIRQGLSDETNES